MAQYWLGFATTATRFTEGDLLLVYDHAPNGDKENKIFAWFGPVELTDAERASLDRVDGVPVKRMTKAEFAALDPVYAAKAFDPGQYVAPGEVGTIDKTVLLTTVKDTGNPLPEKGIK